MCSRLTITSTVFLFFFYSCVAHRDLHSFPTRRSSDLPAPASRGSAASNRALPASSLPRSGGAAERGRDEAGRARLDRKSTRLNSSHRCISYAVFCLKKKKKQHDHKH